MFYICILYALQTKLLQSILTCNMYYLKLCLIGSLPGSNAPFQVCQCRTVCVCPTADSSFKCPQPVSSGSILTSLTAPEKSNPVSRQVESIGLCIKSEKIFTKVKVMVEFRQLMLDRYCRPRKRLCDKSGLRGGV